MKPMHVQNDALATEKSAVRPPQVLGATEFRRVYGGMPVRTGARAGVGIGTERD
jgi:hypothetical protein